jgi:2-methylisocitrate lyase-like PEP mutase family enzyme
LPNAWNAMSARLIEHAGARAIATTGAGVSWALGRPDGHGLTRADMIEAVG